MQAWLAAVVGVVVIGVVLELVTRERRMGKLIRGIYAFFVLFVIVSPVPKLLGQRPDFWQTPATLIDQAVVDSLQQTTRQAQVQQILRERGYPDALVLVQGNQVYVCLNQAVSPEEMSALEKQLGAGVCIL